MICEIDVVANRAIRLADRILCKIGSPAITHLKLQKLLFYTYGAVLAESAEGEVGEIPFEAWKHGPVNPAVYDKYKGRGSEPLPTPLSVTPYCGAVEQCIEDVLNIYGKLSAWQLREQSHLETPWERAWASDDKSISTDELRTYFASKFARGNVTAPELLTQVWSLSFDGLPQARFESLHSLARALA